MILSQDLLDTMDRLSKYIVSLIAPVASVYSMSSQFGTYSYLYPARCALSSPMCRSLAANPKVLKRHRI